MTSWPVTLSPSKFQHQRTTSDHELITMIRGIDGWENVREVRLQTLSGGMSNILFRVWKTNGSNQSLLLRIYGEATSEIIDREKELSVFSSAAAANIGPKLLAVFKNGRIEEFLSARPLTANEMRAPEISVHLAGKVGRLHSMKMNLSGDKLKHGKKTFEGKHENGHHILEENNNKNKNNENVQRSNDNGCDNNVNNNKSNKNKSNDKTHNNGSSSNNNNHSSQDKDKPHPSAPVDGEVAGAEEGGGLGIIGRRRSSSRDGNRNLFLSSDNTEQRRRSSSGGSSSSTGFRGAGGEDGAAHFYSLEDDYRFGKLPDEKDIGDVWKQMLYFYRLAKEAVAREKDENKRQILEQITDKAGKAAEKLAASLPASLSSLKDDVVFCHGDLQFGNILLHNTEDEESGLSLIDMEYSSHNPRQFDLANHFCEWAADYNSPTPHVMDWSRLPTEEEKKRFICAYLTEVDKQFPTEEKINALYEQVELFFNVSHAFWALWGVIQASKSQSDFDYIAYAQQRAEAITFENDSSPDDVQVYG